ncbi:MAG: carboxypeptidase regulatory-like domain-containing protein [Deltaproteobacteria bacterium]|nr:carboxypeptidase regulatory-like domain-containing protein [Deltaproteobacteria bacterium]
MSCERYAILPILFGGLLLSASTWASTLTGHVTRSDTGAAVAGASVLVRGSGLATTSDSSGAFSVPDIPAGPYGVTCSAPGLVGQSTGAVDLSADAVQDFVLDPAPAGSVAAGGVAMCGGAACPGLIILARQDDETVARALGSADGTWSMPLAAGSYDLWAIAYQYVMQRRVQVAVSAASPPVIDFSLTAAPRRYTLSGGVGLSDNPLDRSGSEVQLHGQLSTVQASTNAGGSYQLSAAPTGLLSLSARHAGYNPQIQIDVLVEGDRMLSFLLHRPGGSSTTDPTYSVRGVIRLLPELPDGGYADGEVPDGGIPQPYTAAGTRVSLWTDDGRYRNTTSTAGSGRFVFFEVPAGTYRLGSSREGFFTKILDDPLPVGSDQWVELELSPDASYDWGPGEQGADLGCGCGPTSARASCAAAALALAALCSQAVRRRRRRP